MSAGVSASAPLPRSLPAHVGGRVPLARPASASAQAQPTFSSPRTADYGVFFDLWRQQPSLPVALLSNCAVSRTLLWLEAAALCFGVSFVSLERQGRLVRDAGAVWKALWTGEGKHW